MPVSFFTRFLVANIPVPPHKSIAQTIAQISPGGWRKISVVANPPTSPISVCVSLCLSLWHKRWSPLCSRGLELYQLLKLRATTIWRATDQDCVFTYSCGSKRFPTAAAPRISITLHTLQNSGKKLSQKEFWEETARQKNASSRTSRERICGGCNNVEFSHPRLI